MTERLDAELLEAVQRLRADARVERASLEERVGRIAAQDASGEPEFAHDIGAELRLAAWRLLAIARLEHLAFSERPDIRLRVSGEESLWEVMRLRRTREDDRAEDTLRRASREGRLLVYHERPDLDQARVTEKILRKLSRTTPVPNSVLVVVSDSDHIYSTDLVAFAARDATLLARRGGRSCPFEFLAAWQPAWTSPLYYVSADTGLGTQALHGIVSSLPRARAV